MPAPRARRRIAREHELRAHCARGRAAETLLLGIVVMYGSIAYAVSLRTCEVAIRIALGVDPADAPTLVIRGARASSLPGL